MPLPLMSFLKKLCSDGMFFPEDYFFQLEKGAFDFCIAGSTRWMRCVRAFVQVRSCQGARACECECECACVCWCLRACVCMCEHVCVDVSFVLSSVRVFSVSEPVRLVLHLLRRPFILHKGVAEAAYRDLDARQLALIVAQIREFNKGVLVLLECAV